jgi:hypothetical protein
MADEQCNGGLNDGRFGRVKRAQSNQVGPRMRLAWGKSVTSREGLSLFWREIIRLKRWTRRAQVYNHFSWNSGQGKGMKMMGTWDCQFVYFSLPTRWDELI